MTLSQGALWQVADTHKPVMTYVTNERLGSTSDVAGHAVALPLVVWTKHYNAFFFPAPILE